MKRDVTLFLVRKGVPVISGDPVHFRNKKRRHKFVLFRDQRALTIINADSSISTTVNITTPTFPMIITPLTNRRGNSLYDRLIEDNIEILGGSYVSGYFWRSWIAWSSMVLANSLTNKLKSFSWLGFMQGFGFAALHLHEPRGTQRRFDARRCHGILSGWCSIFVDEM